MRRITMTSGNRPTPRPLETVQGSTDRSRALVLAVSPTMYRSLSDQQQPTIRRVDVFGMDLGGYYYGVSQSTSERLIIT